MRTDVHPTNPAWEELYAEGRQLNRYPFDSVVSFVFSNAPSKPRAETQVLEVGCGAGNNLWFAAREGFRVTGIDGSPSAIAYARQRFEGEGLNGDFHVVPFGPLPFPDSTFDLAVDRGGLTCAGRSVAMLAAREVWRVLRPGGRFFSVLYSIRNTGASSGVARGDGLFGEFTAGYQQQAEAGVACFYDRQQASALFPSPGWEVRSLRHIEDTNDSGDDVYAEWRVVAEKC